MKTLVFSKDELETIKFLLWQNPCRSGCVLDYKKLIVMLLIRMGYINANLKEM